MRQLLAFLLGLYLTLPALADELLIATATNFKPAMIDIGQSFQAQSGHTVSISSASTGVIYNQVLHGAPFHIFLAADAKHPQLLEQSGQAIANTRFTYAWGKLVLSYRKELQPIAAQGLRELLQQPGLSLVIANPDHAPYGRAAAEVLQQQPLSPDRRLLRATNVGQAYQMWFSGGADAALVALSSAPANYLDIPPNWYAPLQQQVVLLKPGENLAAATQFLQYLESTAARKIIQRHGYATEAPGRG